MFFSYDHLYQAYQKARKSKTYNKEIVNRSLEEEINLQQLYHELITEKYIIGMPTRYVIQDPVLREIIAIPFRDRIVQHLIHQALYPIVEKQAIHDVYSNRIGKGSLYGIQRISRFMRACSENYTKDTRILKLDIQSFFLSIQKEILYQEICRIVSKNLRSSSRYDRKGIMKLIHQTIFKDYRMYQDVSIPRLNQKFPYRKRMQSTNGTHGLPLGNLTSQLFANIYLHCFDLFVKHELHIKYYGRYVDDFILIHHDKKYLIECSHRIKDFLRTKLKLNLHPNKFYLQYYKKGVKFLGVMIYPHYRVLGKRTISRAFQKLKKKNKADQCIDPRQSRMSYDGLAKHHKCYRLRERRKELYLKKYGDVDNRSK